MKLIKGVIKYHYIIIYNIYTSKKRKQNYIKSNKFIIQWEIDFKQRKIKLLD